MPESYNLKYCVFPCLDIIGQYVKIVEDSQKEIDGIHRMIESKKLDKTKLVQENNKSLVIFGNKKSLQQYETCLANERIINKRVLGELED